MENLIKIAEQFQISGQIKGINPLGAGNINDTFLVTTAPSSADNYILQAINDRIFTNVEALQDNIARVTNHIRAKLVASSATDIERKVLTLIPTKEGKTYLRDADNRPWRMTKYIANSVTRDIVNKSSAYECGLAFGQFQSWLTDLSPLPIDTIPDFHNMTLRITQLEDAVKNDAKGRLVEVKEMYESIMKYAPQMCSLQDRLSKGELPIRVVHCDTKVNNMLFDATTGEFLCVIDLDTVMKGCITSDCGDFFRTGAASVSENEADLSKISFNFDVFSSFVRGYIKSTKEFLTPAEMQLIPFSAQLFPYMQCVRFLTDYINGDTYYKIQYPTHNLVRAKNQWRLFEKVTEQVERMVSEVNQIYQKELG